METFDTRPAESVTVLLKGGFGNQVFQYAAAWALVGRNRPDAIRVLSYGSEWGEGHPDLQSVLGVAVEYPNRASRTRYPGVAVRESWKDSVSAAIASVAARVSDTILIRQSDPFAPPGHAVARHYVLDGFFQHPKWWRDSWHWVADRINDNAPPQVQVLRNLERPAIKVRRSDYVGRGIVLTDEYYRASIAALELKDETITVVCEDFACLPEFQELLAEANCSLRATESITGNRNFDDFWNLVASPRQVLANSSYCWWAAAAAQAAMPQTRVTYPVPWLPNTWSSGPLPDMGVPGWLAIPTDFE